MFCSLVMLLEAWCCLCSCRHSHLLRAYCLASGEETFSPVRAPERFSPFPWTPLLRTPVLLGRTVFGLCAARSHKARLGVDSFSAAFPREVAEGSGLCVFYQYCRFGQLSARAHLLFAKTLSPPSRPEGYTRATGHRVGVWRRCLEHRWSHR